MEQSIVSNLALYKTRFLRSLSAGQQAAADFGRPVFLAASFYLTARKNKMKAST